MYMYTRTICRSIINALYDEAWYVIICTFHIFNMYMYNDVHVPYYNIYICNVRNIILLCYVMDRN